MDTADTKKTVLLLFESAKDLTKLVALLRSDFSVLTARAPDVAVRHLVEHPVDLVVIHVNHEGPDEVFRQLQGMEPRPRLMIVAPLWAAGFLTRAARFRADGVLRSTDAEEMAAAVAAHLQI